MDSLEEVGKELAPLQGAEPVGRNKRSALRHIPAVSESFSLKTLHHE
jgi:hypothetical protein